MVAGGEYHEQTMNSQMVAGWEDPLWVVFTSIPPVIQQMVFLPERLVTRTKDSLKVTKPWCKTVGPASAPPCWAVGKPQDNDPGVGKCSLRCGTARAGSGDHVVLRLLDTQTPLGAMQELRTEWGPAGWILPGAKGEKRRPPAGSRGMDDGQERVLNLSAVVGLGLAWLWL